MASHPQSGPTGRLHRVSAKAAYSRSARDRLIASRSKLNGVNAALRQALASGRVGGSDQLERARGAIEESLAEAERRLAQLQKAGDDGWETLRDGVDDAQEDLARAIKYLVARFDDEATDTSGRVEQ